MIEESYILNRNSFSFNEYIMHFEYQNPTRIVFGTGTLSKLGEVVREYGRKPLSLLAAVA